MKKAIDERIIINNDDDDVYKKNADFPDVALFHGLIIPWTAGSNPLTHAVANGCSAISKKLLPLLRHLLNKYISFREY